MSQFTINIDDAHLQQTHAAVSAMKADVDGERSWLAAANRPIQPSGQVWPVADALVTAWDERLRKLGQWYDKLSADLGALACDIETVRGIHQLAEDTASDLAKKVMG